MTNNRTEQQALVNGLTPTVDLDELQPAMVQDGYVFKKDIAGTATIDGTGSAILSFSSIDQFTVTLTGTGTATITIQDLEIGQRGKILVSKAVKSMNVVFQGVDTADYIELLTTGNLFFEVENIGGQIVLKQTGTGRNGNITESDFTTDGLTIASIDYFYYKIDKRVCRVWGRFSCTFTTSPIPSFSLLFSNRIFGTILTGNAYTGAYQFTAIQDTTVTSRTAESCLIVDTGTLHELSFETEFEGGTGYVPTGNKGRVVFNIEFPIK